MTVKRSILVCIALLASTLCVPASAAPTTTCFGMQPTKVGTDGPDNIFGTSRADVILARGGNDRVLGRDGADRICGGYGRDTVHGQAGDDRVTGDQQDDDFVTGGKGNDRLYGGPDGGFLDAGEGNDYLNAGTTLDGTGGAILDGGSGNDTINSGSLFFLVLSFQSATGPVTITGSARGPIVATGGNIGTDTYEGYFARIRGSHYGDTITWYTKGFLNCGSCGMALYGGLGNDTLTGIDNGDWDTGDINSFFISGDEGNDVLASRDECAAPCEGSAWFVLNGGAGDDDHRVRGDYSEAHDHLGTDRMVGDFNVNILDVRDAAGGDEVDGRGGNDTCTVDAGDLRSNCE